MSDTSARTKSVPFPYNSVKNISAPEDVEAGRRVLAGNAPATSFLDLEDDENVREYLVDAEGKMKRSPTLVHKAIRETLKNNPEDFCILNGGICIVARAAEVDEKKKVITLTRPSIINGSQTQGELRRYLGQMGPDNGLCVPSVTFELIITTDDDLIAEVSIARNFQNDVAALSIASRRGHLDDLQAAVEQGIPGAKLRMKETDLSVDFVDTEKLIQVLFALAPEQVIEKLDDASSFKNKAFTYSKKTRCLKLFERVYSLRDEDPYDQLYKFFIDAAPTAWELYKKWKSHQGFYGTKLRAIQRASDGTILEVPDGLIFPILASLSAFVKRRGSTWNIEAPASFDEAKLISAAASDYMEIADSNPQQMGKSKACYSSLLRLTQIYADLSGAR